MLRRQKIKDSRQLSKRSLDLIQSKALADNELLRSILLGSFDLANMALALIANPVVALVLRILIGGARLALLETKAKKIESLIEVKED